MNLGPKSAERRHFIGGSDARIIMGADEAALVRLWQENRGEVEPEDLSGNLIVQLGVATEGLNRRWYQGDTGQVITDIQRHVKHASLGWMAATLDGRVGGTADGELEVCVMDKRALHVLAFPVRKSGTDWADAVSKKRIDLAPTHWRPRRRDDRV